MFIEQKSFHFLQLTSSAINNKSSNNNVIWHQRVSLDSFYRSTYRLVSILKTLQPISEIYATALQCFKNTV